MEQTRTPGLALIKLLAIIGFFAILLGIILLAYYGVRHFPSFFGQLASIAERVNTYRPGESFTLSLPKTVVNSGEVFTLSWSNRKDADGYTFSYECVSGIVVSVKSEGEAYRDVSCTDTLALPSEVNGLFVKIDADRSRMSDVLFTVEAMVDEERSAVDTGTVTVVNATVGENEPPKTPTPKPDTGSLPPKTQTPPPSRPTGSSQVGGSIVSILPQSYPDGFTDLSIRYMGVGELEDGVFVPKGTWHEDGRAAFRFEVKNIGTKTSDTWTYALTLPNGSVYESDAQSGLKPNERAQFTIGFSLSDDNKSAVTIKGDVDTKNDTNEKNDSFNWSVRVAD